MTGWGLGVDLGTSFSTAATWANGRVEVLEVNGARRIPSTVVLSEDGQLLGGVLAQRQASRVPDRVERNPKRYVGRRPMLLGGTPVDVRDALAALLGLFVAEARARFDGTAPGAVVLTHPVAWGTDRRAVLRESAATVLPDAEVVLVEEPVAAAVHYADDHRLRPDDLVAVYDLGGGTFDTAVLTVRDGGDGDPAGGFEVVGAPGGDDEIGGEVFDERVLGHFGEQLRRLVPQWWEQATSRPERRWQAAVAALLDEARQAKETLSEYETARQYIPDADVDVTISREEFEGLVGDDVERTMNLMSATLEQPGLRPDRLRGVFLTGGGSRIPLAQAAARERYGKLVRTWADPKTVVALGAARLAQRPVGRSGVRTLPAGRPPPRPPEQVLVTGPGPGPGPAPVPAGPPGAPPAGPSAAPPSGPSSGPVPVVGPWIGFPAAPPIGPLVGPPSGPPSRAPSGASGPPSGRQQAVGPWTGRQQAVGPWTGPQQAMGPTPDPGLPELRVVQDGVLEARLVDDRLYAWCVAADRGHLLMAMDADGHVTRGVPVGQLLSWAAGPDGLLVTERRGGQVLVHALSPELSIRSTRPLPAGGIPTVLLSGSRGWVFYRPRRATGVDNSAGLPWGEVGDLCMLAVDLNAVFMQEQPAVLLGQHALWYLNENGVLRRLLDQDSPTGGTPAPTGVEGECAVISGQFASVVTGLVKRRYRDVRPSQVITLVAAGGGGAGWRIGRPGQPWVHQVRHHGDGWALATAAGLEVGELNGPTTIVLPRPRAGAQRWFGADRLFGVTMQQALPSRGVSVHVLAGAAVEPVLELPGDTLLGHLSSLFPTERPRVAAEPGRLWLATGAAGRSRIHEVTAGGATQRVQAPGWVEPVGARDGRLWCLSASDVPAGPGRTTPARLGHLPLD